MVDVFTILFTHAIMLVAFWRLMQRADLDADEATAQPARPWLKDTQKAPDDA